MAKDWKDVFKNETPKLDEVVTVYEYGTQEEINVLWDGKDFYQNINGRKVIILASHWRRG